MAKLQQTNNEVENKIEIKETDGKQTDCKSSENISMEEMLKIIEQLKQENFNLKEIKVTEENNNKTPSVTSNLINQYEDNTTKLIEALTNKRSDKEVVIIHNREMIGGLSTHLSLMGANIDFRKLGEERVLSWQQFEECVSKYRKFFEKEIILLAPQHADLVEKYDIPCASKDGNVSFNKKSFNNLGTMSNNELEQFYMGLSENDKKFILNYWMGKVYEKDSAFYDRYKLELLNRLSNSNIFDNMLTVMNNEFAKK